MRKLAALAFSFLPVICNATGMAPAGQHRNQLFFSGFETGGVCCGRTSFNVDAWGTGESQWESSSWPNTKAVQRGMNGEVPRTGLWMAQFEIQNGQYHTDGNYRNQLETYNIREGYEYWIGFSIYLPSTPWNAYESKTSNWTGGGTEQPNPSDPCDNSARMGVTYVNEPPLGRTFRVQQNDRHPLADFLNKWTDVVIHMNTAGDNNVGYFEYWLNGTFHGRRNSSIQNADSQGCPIGTQMNYKIGIYGSPASSSIPALVYFDEFRLIETTAGNYNMVAPGQGGGSPPPAAVPVAPTSVTIQ